MPFVTFLLLIVILLAVMGVIVKSFAAFPLIGVGIVAGLIWWKTASENAAKTAAQERQVNLSLTCRKCSGLATPINGTKNRYRCSTCNRQFAGSHHGY